MTSPSLSGGHVPATENERSYRLKLSTRLVVVGSVGDVLRIILWWLDAKNTLKAPENGLMGVISEA